MTIIAIDGSQRSAARVAGLTFLLTTAVVVFVNFAIHERLFVAGDAAQTARNILAHEGLFRVGVACDLIYCAGLIVLIAALYVILKPAGHGLALLAAFWRLLYALTWVLMTLNLFTALRLVKAADYLRVFEADRLQSLARLELSARFDAYYVGLLFYGLSSALCGCLFFKSRYVPRALGAFGVVSSVWCAACTFAFIVSPAFAGTVNLWWFDSPMGIFEIVTGLWLLLKGLGARGRDGLSEPGAAS
ncbi:MAG: DUF4386 domain-containing protein [Acidobacteriota bacterium]|nr:DUF4386 domain-containing protein [Acidobacteriota bacterium]